MHFFDLIEIVVRLDSSRALRILIDPLANTGRLDAPRPGAHPPSNGTSTNLDSIRKRLDHFYPESHSFQIFDQDGWVYAVMEINERAQRSGDSTAA